MEDFSSSSVPNLEKKTFLVAARGMFTFSSHILALKAMGLFHSHTFCGVLL